ncbi:MerR family transcriptional regulator [Lichenibacterium dinghuense]|uniref:MerR family transcriptional regulator n=1 Tax=Lichenibacterium dinghuense TaxID=2895977 RepID=UPI001F1DBBE8|nr:MerR family transcriptional regulator [Lichenibacterium sp. 6Y81]
MTDRPAPQKSQDAYRTISEVADELGLPQHVLRFWETRFPQVKPLKRAGGRRFYRPEDVALLRAVKTLLYDEGYTIKGVQRLLAEHGARNVAGALARSQAAAPRSEPPVAAPGHRPDREGDEPPPAPEPREPALPEPAVRETPARVPAAARPALPALRGPEPARARAAEEAGVVERMSAVLADLAECARLLASVRSA